MQEILANPKLDILQTILELGCQSRCSDVQSKPDKRLNADETAWRYSSF